MTDNENMHPKLKVQRITPKSEFLLRIESNQKASSSKIIKPFAHVSYFQADWEDMVTVYTGSDLNHFRGSEFLNSESIPTYKSSK